MQDRSQFINSYTKSGAINNIFCNKRDTTLLLSLVCAILLRRHLLRRLDWGTITTTCRCANNGTIHTKYLEMESSVHYHANYARFVMQFLQIVHSSTITVFDKNVEIEVTRVDGVIFM